MGRGFGSYLVVRGASRDTKLRRLTAPERLAFFLGILSIAAGSEPRGYLRIGSIEATVDDIAHEADVPPRAAREALRKLLEVGVLERDPQIGALRVVRWDDHQPEPQRRRPSDEPEATRERKRQQRARQKLPFDDEEAGPARPPLPRRPTGRRGRDQERYAEQVAAYAADRFPDVPEPNRSQMVMHAISNGPVTDEHVEAFVRHWSPVPEVA